MLDAYLCVCLRVKREEEMWGPVLGCCICASVCLPSAQVLKCGASAAAVSVCAARMRPCSATAQRPVGNAFNRESSPQRSCLQVHLFIWSSNSSVSQLAIMVDCALSLDDSTYSSSSSQRKREGVGRTKSGSKERQRPGKDPAPCDTSVVAIITLLASTRPCPITQRCQGRRHVTPHNAQHSSQ